MAWLAVNKDGLGEMLFPLIKPERCEDHIGWWSDGKIMFLSPGTIEKIIDRKLTWEDEPVEI